MEVQSIYSPFFWVAFLGIYLQRYISTCYQKQNNRTVFGFAIYIFSVKLPYLPMVWHTSHFSQKHDGRDCQFNRCGFSVSVHHALHSICWEGEKGGYLFAYNMYWLIVLMNDGRLWKILLIELFPSCLWQIKMLGLLLAVFGLFIVIVVGSLQITDLPLRRNVVGILSCASLVSMFASPLFIIVSLYFLSFFSIFCW